MQAEIKKSNQSVFHTSEIKGFKLASAEVKHLNSVAIGIYLPVGSRHEKNLPAGISHFAEHMIFKGTDKRSAIEIAIDAESAGCTLNAYTSEDHTVLEMRGSDTQTATMLEIMADMLWNSRFEEKEINNERHVIEEEILDYEESPKDHLQDLLSQALWKNNPLGMPITGTVQSIQKITSKELHHFVQSFYTVSGITVAAAGKINHKELEKHIQTIFPTLKQGQQPSIEPITSAPSNVVHRAGLEQTQLAFGFRTIGRHHADRTAFSLLSLLLGETMSSLLFQRLREELGLCYSIQTEVEFFEDTGQLSISSAFDPEDLDLAEQEIMLILEELGKTGISKKQLEQTQSYAINQTRIALESSQAYMGWIGDSVFCYDQIITPEKSIANIAAVTVEDIQRLAQTYLQPQQAVKAIIL